jgi:uncharacterized membrane protein (DUF4010 family)
VTPAAESLLGVVAAAVGGAAVGIERQWSGHATGPAARLGGIRTFTLLGGVAGLAGWLWSRGVQVPAAVVLAGVLGLVVAGYVAASRRDPEGTTETAALVVVVAGLLAGLGEIRLASAVIALTTLLLVEKTRLHALVAGIDDAGFRAGVRFVVMAVVILPLLPAGPVGPLGGIRPRELWALVLLFSGLSFAGYVARRMVGAKRGYPLAGLLGGMISSTSVSLVFARASRGRADLARPLAVGVLGACTIMFLRMLVATAILEWSLAVALAPFLVLPFVVGGLAVALDLRAPQASAAALDPPRNPLGFVVALQMVLIFQIVLWLVVAVRDAWGHAGLLASAAVVGLTDVDALTISMVHGLQTGTPVGTAARALALGAMANTLFKLGVVLGIGRGRFRARAAAALGAIALALLVSLVALG